MGQKEKRETWIKLYRKIDKNPLWEDKPFAKGQAWIDLLLIANHTDGQFTDRRGNIIDGKRGTVYRSINFLAERWGWSRKKVDRFLSQLWSQGVLEVSKKRASDCTSIFIVNYDNYQTFGTSYGARKEQDKNKSGTSEEQVRHIYKNDKEGIRMNKKEKEKPAALPFTRSQNDENEDVGIDLFNMSDEEYAEMKRKIENGDIRI